MDFSRGVRREPPQSRGSRDIDLRHSIRMRVQKTPDLAVTLESRARTPPRKDLREKGCTTTAQDVEPRAKSPPRKDLTEKISAAISHEDM